MSFRIYKCYYGVHTLSSSSNSMTFSMTLSLAVTFQNFQIFPCFRAFLDLTKQLDINSGVLQRDKWKCVPFLLFNFSPLFYIVLVFTSTATYNLPNFYEFPSPTIKFHWLCQFPGLENEILKFNDFPTLFITRTNSDTLLNIFHSVFFKFKRERNRNNQHCHSIIVFGKIIVIQ